MPEHNRSEVNERLDMVKERLDVLIALTVCQLRKETEPKHLLSALSKMRVSRQTIARVLGSTPDAIRMALKRGRGAERSSAASNRGSGQGKGR